MSERNGSFEHVRLLLRGLFHPETGPYAEPRDEGNTMQAIGQMREAAQSLKAVTEKVVAPPPRQQDTLETAMRRLAEKLNEN